VRSVQVYPSTFEFETRILKSTKTLVERTAIDRVMVVAMAGPGLPDRAPIDGAREVLRVGARLEGDRFWARALRFVEWSGRVLWQLRREKIDVVNCHSLSVLPLCVALKLLHGAILVYEPHELETETATFTGARRRLAKWVERALIGQAVATIVVSDSICRHYRADYGLRDVVTLMNVPERNASLDLTHNPVFRRLFGIPESDFIFMYQGALEEVRGVGMLLDVFKSLPEDRHIVFLGFGPMEDAIRVASSRHPNIHFHAAVPPAKVIEYTLGADVGFALLDDSCLNHRCALPNKLFHYLHAGLPVIVSDLEEMGALVDYWACGWRVANTTNAIAVRSAGITRADVARAAAGARRCREALVWETEADKLSALYDRILARLSATAASITSSRP
jgi:glycosyltransferase involved in cell wall biosynthesis